ncbi:hypothetical protein dsx2_2267 [Desulfovibrio sp. X2]|uniref:3D domain-containing protein n=1 Tax=Desulfovibrio sp. X2 TaxID=941449 RepID=UPI0003587822|nr:3D domain-containing protein [Desulfovibrio sp. X2]EPR43650.1 hypothetical protein dsx2_2267 [Desulfovibrio sp. X2]
MNKALSFLAITVTLAAAFWAHREFDSVRAELRHSQDQTFRLEAEVEKGRTAVALLHKFVLMNQEKLKSMTRRKILTVTAYSPRECETDSTPFITASNSPVRAGIVAVSRDLFENGWVFGKKVYIKNLGVFVIDDLMAESKRDHLDIFIYDPVQAQNFGAKKLEVFLLGA